MKFDVWTSGSLPAVDCIVVGVFEDGELGDEGRNADLDVGGRITRALKAGDFSGRGGETLLLVPESGAAPRALLTGLGSRKSFGRKGWRKALATALQALLRTRIGSVAIALERPPAAELDDYYLGRAVAELSGAALYRINDLKTGKKPRTPALTRIVAGPVGREGVEDARRGLAQGDAIAAAMKVQRDLANLPGNVCTPSFLAEEARALARQHAGLKVEVLDPAAIRRERMNCLLAVAQGSSEPARFVVMEYRGRTAGGGRGKRATRRGAGGPVVLVGKGVTFDTGGISLKDPGAMDEMKFDMTGAAAVIAAMTLVASLKLPLHVVGLVAAVENMPDGKAIKPGDIVTSAAGHTVEILNTDAEGRLILCDALHYARRYEPAVVIDIATLTGACVVALGHHHTGVIANDDALAAELVAAGTRADDRAWQLPLTEDYFEQLKSNFADFANVGGRDGGAITAAAFLGRFAEGLRWAHLDIAGTAWGSGSAKASTGRPLPLLADFLLQQTRA